MPKYEPPKKDVAEILESLGLNPNEYAVELQTEDTIVLLHYKTHLEVTLRKGVKRDWL